MGILWMGSRINIRIYPYIYDNISKTNNMKKLICRLFHKPKGHWYYKEMNNGRMIAYCGICDCVFKMAKNK